MLVSLPVLSDDLSLVIGDVFVWTCVLVIVGSLTLDVPDLVLILLGTPSFSLVSLFIFSNICAPAVILGRGTILKKRSFTYCLGFQSLLAF